MSNNGHSRKILPSNRNDYKRPTILPFLSSSRVDNNKSPLCRSEPNNVSGDSRETRNEEKERGASLARASFVRAGMTT